PQTDVRETATAYHLDIELPGLRNKSDVRLKWTGGRTLYIEAAIKCQPLPEEALLSSANGSLAGKNKSEASDKNHSKEEKPVQFVKRERKTGEVARAFNFPVDVKQDETIAKLAYGVLTITVPK
ncbi:HSP20-like chaperone, partial [Coniella lustricola]